MNGRTCEDKGAPHQNQHAKMGEKSFTQNHRQQQKRRHLLRRRARGQQCSAPSSTALPLLACWMPLRPRRPRAPRRRFAVRCSRPRPRGRARAQATTLANQAAACGVRGRAAAGAAGVCRSSLAATRTRFALASARPSPWALREQRQRWPRAPRGQGGRERQPHARAWARRCEPAWRRQSAAGSDCAGCPPEREQLPPPR